MLIFLSFPPFHQPFAHRPESAGRARIQVATLTFCAASFAPLAHAGSRYYGRAFAHIPSLFYQLDFTDIHILRQDTRHSPHY